MLNGHDHLEFMCGVKGLPIALRIGFHNGIEALLPPSNPNHTEEIDFGVSTTKNINGVLDGLFHAINHKN
eukprot:4276253-Heterocapsa_arctica.AAC.1